MFPGIDKILQLDVDTVVVDDISDLWNIDLKNKWFAAVEETHSTYKPFGPKYYNIGVAMFNLDQIRKDQVDEKLIHYLNTVTTPYIDQDAWNRYGIGKDVKLPSRYNESIVTAYSETPAIVHYAGFKDWQNSDRVPRREYLKKYREMTWKEALNGKGNDRGSNV